MTLSGHSAAPSRLSSIVGGLAQTAVSTFTGNQGLNIIEPLIFEQDRPGTCAVRVPSFTSASTPKLGHHARSSPIGLPSLSEPTVMRHYVRLSRKNYSIDDNMLPSSNPRINEQIARLPGFADIHPYQPESTVKGAKEALAELGGFLLEITGMSGVTLAPKAGAHGEHTGLMAIRAAHIKSGQDQQRRVCLCLDSAHGTNPATSAQVGYKVVTVKSLADGSIDMNDLKSKLNEEVACIMITNPSTIGLFETNFKEVSDLVHKAGGYVYMDGANLNAILGRVRPADLGVDAMHFNLHKTMSTPHGGGGQGSGPVVFSPVLTPFMPCPAVVRQSDLDPELSRTLPSAKIDGIRYCTLDNHHVPESIGEIGGFHGNFGICMRALGWLKAMGREGLSKASGDAVLNARYLFHHLKDTLSAPYREQPCMHEALFDDTWLKGTGVSTMDVAKTLIDEGFHPPTVYFPMVVSGAMLVEPTGN
ncbi:hypothetical protein GEMRC1_003263 [Eukaryota sp. GEM-RC1]